MEFDDWTMNKMYILHEFVMFHYILYHVVCIFTCVNSQWRLQLDWKTQWYPILNWIECQRHLLLHMHMHWCKKCIESLFKTVANTLNYFKFNIYMEEQSIDNIFFAFVNEDSRWHWTFELFFLGIVSSYRMKHEFVFKFLS